ncbi:alpha/beta hydrolase [Rhodococcus sp. IEGM 1354]|uniref:alpha/beta hydrolase n=1 Tax=Rhodococcus sp. IEGM 1354 TaxID=3047088 RepID=UPI0024B84C87|nr:alpha/beta hydrolase [Rhodococcus sp. IEGM 1354]MDI9930722.1 alpha/beta hydrolase [Rhodococcus sp. IEGM 1354]
MTAGRRPEPAPDLAALLGQLMPSDRSEVTPEQQRAEYNGFVDMLRGPEVPFAGSVVDEQLPGAPGNPDIVVRRYVPATSPRPSDVLIYFHGGGWVLGNLDTHDRFPRAIAQQLQLAVVSVEYRLAPENPFPAAFVDCSTVVDNLSRTASWVGLCGDSAGANLAAAISARRAVDSTVPVDAQVLIYPGLSVPSEVPDRSLDGLGLDRSDIDYFWSSYRGDSEPDARLAPLMHSDPIPAPPTLVTTAGCDPLRVDGVDYVARLVDADVPVAYLPFPHLIHGWLELAEAIPSASEARALLIEAIGDLRDSTIRRPADVQR